MDKLERKMLEMDDFIDDMLEKQSTHDDDSIKFLESLREKLKQGCINSHNGADIEPLNGEFMTIGWAAKPYNPDNELDYIISMAKAMGGIGQNGVPDCDMGFRKELIIIEDCSMDAISDMKAMKIDAVKNFGEISQDWYVKFNKCNIFDKDFRKHLLKLYRDNTHTYRAEDGNRYVDESSRMKFQHMFLSFVDDYLKILTLDKWIEKHNSKDKSKFQFFSTSLSDRQLLEIRDVLVDCKGGSYGKDKRYLAPIKDDDWLYLFGRKNPINPQKPQFIGSNQILMNVMQQICGANTTLKPIVKNHFRVVNPPKADKRSTPTPLGEKLSEIISQ